MYRAVKTFCGIVNMTRGEVRELPEEHAKELLKAGYIVDLTEKQKKAAEVKAASKTTTSKKRATK